MNTLPVYNFVILSGTSEDELIDCTNYFPQQWPHKTYEDNEGNR